MPRTSQMEKTSTVETEKKFAIRVGAKTEAKGDSKLNEDSAFISREKMTAGVFDGVGGGLGGQEASGAAAKIAKEELSLVPNDASAEEWKLAIKAALEKAQIKVTEISNKLFFDSLGDRSVAVAYRDKPQKEIEKLMGEKDTSPGGTTASVVKMLERPDGGVDLVFGHTGDSRIYVFKKTGELKQLTEDQGLLEQAVQNGYYTQEEADFIDQVSSKEDIIKKFGQEKGGRVSFDYKNLRRGIRSALGLSDVKFQTGIEHLEPGDQAIITSDGIHDNLTKEEIKAEIMKGGTPEEISARLVATAKIISGEGKLRSKNDDKTALVIETPEITGAEAVEKLTSLTSEQIEQYRAATEALRGELEELQKLLPLAKHVEAGRTVLTSKEKKKKIAEFGVAGIEDRLRKIEEDIISYEYALAKNSGDKAVAEKMKNRYQELQKEKLERLRARDKEQSASQIEEIKRAIGAR